MSDPNVLAVQKWVNATYKNAPGYVPCKEDGKTGWATVDCLAQGLQHELGISPTVKNFGPGTLKAVKNRNIKPGKETNAKIIRIYDSALWCKGYYGSAKPGEWDQQAESSLNSLIIDMGLTGTGALDADMWARVTRSMLRMDQFRIVPGGNRTTNRIQRYLNSRYVQGIRIPAMDLVPCDGQYSRDVQQGLMLAIQYELGLDKNTINGYFGSGTKQALKSKGTGMSPDDLGDELALLFRAACWFNSPTYTAVGAPVHYGADWVFSSSSSLDTVNWVDAFQKFSQISTSGTYNYTTWAQLLISSGDTSRDAEGCDTAAYTSHDRAKTLKANGYRIIGRYLDEHLDPGDPYYLGKALRPGEAQGIIDAGMGLYPIFQYNGTQLFNFTYQKGYDQGVQAVVKAMEHGIPHGACIYFAVDYDAQDHEITSNIVPYFNGVRNAIERNGSRYLFGVYGTRNVCDRVSREAGARWSFVSGMSWGYSGNLGYPLPPNWSFNQINEYEFQSGYGLDHNIWRKGSDPGVFKLDKTGHGRESLDAFIAYVEGIENALAERWDRDFDSRKILEGAYIFMRWAEPNYRADNWNLILGSLADEYRKPIEDRGIRYTDMLSYNDPRAHQSITIAHFAAASHGLLAYGTDGTNTTVGDGCGWAGDILNAYTQWREDHRSMRGDDFVLEYVGSTIYESRFSNDDLIADVDAYNLSLLLPGSDAPLDANDGVFLSDALKKYHSGGNGNRASKRFTHFYNKRMGGSRSAFIDRVRNVLLDDEWLSLFDLGKFKFLPEDESQHPENLFANELNPFIEGLHTVITRRMEGEGA